MTNRSRAYHGDHRGVRLLRVVPAPLTCLPTWAALSWSRVIRLEWVLDLKPILEVESCRKKQALYVRSLVQNPLLDLIFYKRCQRSARATFS